MSLAATILFAVYVFAPIASDHPSTNAGNFQLVDVFSLVVLWQYPLVFFQVLKSWRFAHGDIVFREIVIIGVFEIVMTAVWLGLVRTLSQRGVHSARKRFLVIAIAAPRALRLSLACLARPLKQ